MTKSIAASVMVAALASLPVAVHADEVIDEALVILSSDAQQTQGMAMVFSNTMAKRSARVNVLLCDKAGDLALGSYAAQPMTPEITAASLLSMDNQSTQQCRAVPGKADERGQDHRDDPQVNSTLPLSTKNASFQSWLCRGDPMLFSPLG